MHLDNTYIARVIQFKKKGKAILKKGYTRYTRPGEIFAAYTSSDKYQTIGAF